MLLQARKAIGALVGLVFLAAPAAAQTVGPPLEEATIAGVHAAMRDGTLTARRLVEAYLAHQ